MAITMNEIQEHADTVLIGVAIGIAINAILHHVGILLSFNQKLETLEDKLKWHEAIMEEMLQYGLQTSTSPVDDWIPLGVKRWFEAKTPEDKLKEHQFLMEMMREYRLQTSTSYIDIFHTLAVKSWFQKMNNIQERASRMAKGCKIPKVNVISRYRTSKQLTSLISKLDNHLKLVPLVELVLLLWQKTKIEEEIEASKTEIYITPESSEAVVGWAGIGDFVSECISKGIKLAVDQIVYLIKIVLRFHEELKSLDDLLHNIEYLVLSIQVNQDQRRDLQSKRQISEGIASPGIEQEVVSKWIGNMNELQERAYTEREKARQISPWNVVSRYKMCKIITELISLTDKHLRLVPLVNSTICLGQLFHKKERVEGSVRSSATTTKGSTSSAECFRDIEAKGGVAGGGGKTTIARQEIKESFQEMA